MKKIFGVGSFQFDLNENLKQPVSVKRYFQEIESVLKGIVAIGEVGVYYSQEIDDIDTKKIEYDPKKTSDYGLVFPRTHFTNIEFNIHIPYRVQQEFTVFGGLPRVTTENFRVLITDAFHGPLTFVECVGAGEKTYAIDAVHTVSRFLEREINRKGSFISFSFMPPRAFRGSFSITCNKEFVPPVVVSIIPGSVSRDIDITCNETIISEDDALKVIYHKLRKELDLFYHVKRKRLGDLREWQEIQEMIATVQKESEKKVRFYDLPSRLKMSKLRQHLIEELYQFKAGNEIVEYNLANAYDSTYKKDAEVYLKDFISNEIKKDFYFPIDSLIAWLKHSEEHLLKRLEIASVLASAIVGGAIGSFITLMASG